MEKQKVRITLTLEAPRNIINTMHWGKLGATMAKAVPLFKLLHTEVDIGEREDRSESTSGTG